MYKTIEIEQEGSVCVIWLNRPEVHNAFDETMIEEIKHFFIKVSTLSEVRVVVLRGRGKSFCAGADLNWMRNVSQYSFKENLKESGNLSECFYAIYTCKKPTIAVVHGAAMGGANGLLAACDMVLAHVDTVFSLSEVKIGVVPACISPYIIKRIGESRSRELMLTGQRFKGAKAEQLGMVNYALSELDLEIKLMELTELLLSSGPNAVSQCKVLIERVTNQLTLEEAKEYTAEMIARIRMSEEGQEGMAAFLEKRKPKWIEDIR